MLTGRIFERAAIAREKDGADLRDEASNGMSPGVLVVFLV